MIRHVLPGADAVHPDDERCRFCPPVKTEELYCASPVCAVAPVVHDRSPSCPPVSDTTIGEILAAIAKEAEENEDWGPGVDPGKRR